MAGKKDSKGRLPDFIIIGAAKSGTTALHGYLESHPKVFMCDPKEPCFFSHDEVHARGLDWYASLFAGAPEGSVCGEASTTYTRWPKYPHAAERIAEALPDCRFIYLMRKPVDREYSQYAHRMREGVTMTFEESLERDEEQIHLSMYHKQISLYLEHYDADRIHFVIHDDLRERPMETLASVQEFLGLEPVDLTAKGEVKKNVGGVDRYIRYNTTMRIRRNAPIVSDMARALPRPIREWIFLAIKKSPMGRRLAAEYKLAPMLPETRQRLLEQFREPNRRLGEMIGRDLSAWNE